MMGLFDICMLAVALAMDCFTISIVSGVMAPGVRRLPAYMVRMALLFGLFQALMPLLGWLGISTFSAWLEAVDHWIAFGLLVMIGGKMIWQSFHPEEQQAFNPHQMTTQLLLAVATSIDALAVGASFACTGYHRLSQLIFPLFIVGFASLALSVAGWFLGCRFGNIITRRVKPELIGGLILVLIGVKILI